LNLGHHEHDATLATIPWQPSQYRNWLWVGQGSRIRFPMGAFPSTKWLWGPLGTEGSSPEVKRLERGVKTFPCLLLHHATGTWGE